MYAARRRLSSMAINNDDNIGDGIADQPINCANELMLRQLHFVSKNYRRPGLHNRRIFIGAKLMR